MAEIHFFSNSIKFSLSDSLKTSNWLIRVAKKSGKPLKALTYIFCSDPYLATLNKQYLKHAYPTDILTFDLSEMGGIKGEVYISIDRVNENSIEFNQPFSTELRRVMVHGLLHLLGYKDKTDAQKALMRRKEDACLSLWK